MPETETEVRPEDVIALPSTEEEFNEDAVPVFLETVLGRLRAYHDQQENENQPVSLLGFALELIYQTGFQDGQKARRR